MNQQGISFNHYIYMFCKNTYHHIGNKCQRQVYYFELHHCSVLTPLYIFFFAISLPPYRGISYIYILHHMISRCHDMPHEQILISPIDSLMLVCAAHVHMDIIKCDGMAWLLFTRAYYVVYYNALTRLKSYLQIYIAYTFAGRYRNLYATSTWLYAYIRSVNNCSNGC